MTVSPFSSPGAFRAAFESGLERLLHDFDELGTYILTLANAGFDARIWSHLEAPLREKFRRLERDFRKRGQPGLVLDDAGDDLAVFMRLLELGFDGIEHTSIRRLGPWELQFNPLRALRPARMATAVKEAVSIDYDPQGFNFNKPFLRKEIFWRGWLAGRQSALFYNKFPFVDLHALLVPEPRLGRPQRLEAEDHHYIWDLTELLGQTLPGVGFGYNSYGAFASVNHLHFQMFIRDCPLPVTEPLWSHNGGEVDYPLPCQRFTNRESAWRHLQGLHQYKVAYNLLYLPGSLFCLARARQGSIRPAAWSSGFAWHELAGGFTLVDHGDFQRLTQMELEQEMARLALPRGWR